MPTIQVSCRHLLESGPDFDPVLESLGTWVMRLEFTKGTPYIHSCLRLKALSPLMMGLGSGLATTNTYAYVGGVAVIGCR